MKKRWQAEQQRAVQQFFRLAIERNLAIQMMLLLAEIVRMLKQGVGSPPR